MGKTYHEAYHEGKINFKQKDIHCDYQSWLDKYRDYISEYKMSEFKRNLLIE
jgi:hypothetical protein